MAQYFYKVLKLLDGRQVMLSIVSDDVSEELATEMLDCAATAIVSIVAD